jgi:hypothetical protein
MRYKSSIPSTHKRNRPRKVSCYSFGYCGWHNTITHLKQHPIYRQSTNCSNSTSSSAGESSSCDIKLHYMDANRFCNFHFYFRWHIGKILSLTDFSVDPHQFKTGISWLYFAKVVSTFMVHSRCRIDLFLEHYSLFCIHVALQLFREILWHSRKRGSTNSNQENFHQSNTHPGHQFETGINREWHFHYHFSLHCALETYHARVSINTKH